MWSQKIPRGCRFFRYINQILLFVCLFSGLNVLGYFLYIKFSGMLATPHFRVEKSPNGARQLYGDAFRQSSSSTSNYSGSSTEIIHGRQQTTDHKDSKNKVSSFTPLALLQSSFNRNGSRVTTDKVTSASSTMMPDCGDIPFSTADKNLKPFKPVLTGRDRCDFLELTDAFHDAMSKAKVDYFMYGGTLIGSWRHHGFVPWDDDIDFAVPIDKQQKVYRRLMDLKPHFILDVKQKKRWKLYKPGTHRIRHVTWKFPFLDINFYHSNASHIWDHDIGVFGWDYMYPLDWVFPLTLRPFEGRWLPAPQQVEPFLTQTYKLDVCDTGTFTHRTETKASSSERRIVPCEKLKGVLPFVRRTVTARGCDEKLVQGDRVVGHYFFPNSTCTLDKP